MDATGMVTATHAASRCAWTSPPAVIIDSVVPPNASTATVWVDRKYGAITATRKEMMPLKASPPRHTTSTGRMPNLLHSMTLR